MAGFDDLFEPFDDIVSDPEPPKTPESDEWGEDNHWDTGKNEDVWRSGSPDAVWNANESDPTAVDDPDIEEDDVWDEDEYGDEYGDDDDDVWDDVLYIHN